MFPRKQKQVMFKSQDRKGGNRKITLNNDQRQLTMSVLYPNDQVLVLGKVLHSSLQITQH